MVGLILIALGTGGIKPCVSAFGGDQFTPDQVIRDFLKLQLVSDKLAAHCITPYVA